MEYETATARCVITQKSAIPIWVKLKRSHKVQIVK